MVRMVKHIYYDKTYYNHSGVYFPLGEHGELTYVGPSQEFSKPDSAVNQAFSKGLLESVYGGEGFRRSRQPRFSGSTAGSLRGLEKFLSRNC